MASGTTNAAASMANPRPKHSGVGLTASRRVHTDGSETATEAVSRYA